MLSKNLKDKRTEKNFSRNKLAVMTGISERTIQFIEENEVDNPRLNTLQRLSEALDTTIEELIK